VIDEIATCDDWDALRRARRHCRNHIERQLISRRLVEVWNDQPADLAAYNKLRERLEMRLRSG
jgi:hypothetical protein